MSLGGLLSIGRAFERMPARPAAFREAELPTPSFGRRTTVNPASSPTSEPRRRSQESLFGPTSSDSPTQSAIPETSPLSRPHQPTRAAKRSAIPHPPPPANRLIQGELALTAVRVVRNDLSGDGLELIPRPVPAVHGMTLRPDRPRSIVTRGGWRAWLAHWRQWWRSSRS